MQGPHGIFYARRATTILSEGGVCFDCCGILGTFSRRFGRHFAQENIVLDDYLERQGLEFVTFLKMDLEGQELTALSDLSKAFNRCGIETIRTLQIQTGGRSAATRSISNS